MSRKEIERKNEALNEAQREVESTMSELKETLTKMLNSLTAIGDENDRLKQAEIAKKIVEELDNAKREV